MPRNHLTTIVNDAKDETCNSWWLPLLNKAAEIREAEPATSEHLEVLGQVASMYLRPDSSDGPYGRMIEMTNGASTADTRSFTEDGLTIAEQYTDSATPADLRAKCADTLWLTKRDHKQAIIAIDAFLESARNLFDERHWTSPFKRIQRAWQIARHLNHDAKMTEVQAYIEELLLKMDGEDPLFFSARLLELLADTRPSDAPKFAALAEKAAIKASSSGDERRGDELYRQAAKWHRLAKDDAKAEIAEIEAARCLVREAQAHPKNLSKSALLGTALTALKRAKAPQAEIDAAYQGLLSANKKAVGEMGAVGTSVNITDMVKNAEHYVRKDSAWESIQAFAYIVDIPRVAELEKRVKQGLIDHPIQYLFHHTVTNHEGKTVGRIPPLHGATGEDQAIALEHHMSKIMFLDYGVISQAYLWSGWRELNRNWRLDKHDWIQVFRASPFIPPGREGLWARAFECLSMEDIATCTQILAPQLEASIRFVAETQGIPITKHDEQGIQQERSLQKLDEIHRADLEAIFGEDFYFAMRHLLIVNTSANIRNLVAHGLMHPGTMAGPQALMMAWIALRIAISPLVANSTPEPEEAPSVQYPDLEDESE